MSFLQSITSNSKKYDEPFTHWELNKPLTEQQINEIITADIDNPLEHDLNYDGTRIVVGQPLHSSQAGRNSYLQRANINSQWTYNAGLIMFGNTSNIYEGWCNSMDYQGTVAVVQRHPGSANGAVKVYLRGTDNSIVDTITIPGDVNENIGTERGVSLSGDGKTLMISSSTPNGGDTGVVKFYNL